MSKLKLKLTLPPRKRSSGDTIEKQADAFSGQVPRISKLMALAIRMDKLLRTGEVRDLAELARLGNVSQPRVTQILNLTLLAPEIQEELLHLPLVKTGKPGTHEKMVRPIAAEMDWERQREMWARLNGKARTRIKLNRQPSVYVTKAAPEAKEVAVNLASHIQKGKEVLKLEGLAMATSWSLRAREWSQ